MAVIDKVTFTNDAGTTYAIVSEAWAAIKKANPQMLDTFNATEQLALDLGNDKKYKVEGKGTAKEKQTKAEEGDEIYNSIPHSWEINVDELTPDSAGMLITRVWTDEMWAANQSIPAPTIGNGWTRTATFETVSDEISVINESL